jgi:hypothetical protein
MIIFCAISTVLVAYSIIVFVAADIIDALIEYTIVYTV